jgi:flagellar protein FlaE/flagellar protein FlaC
MLGQISAYFGRVMEMLKGTLKKLSGSKKVKKKSKAKNPGGKKKKKKVEEEEFEIDEEVEDIDEEDIDEDEEDFDEADFGGMEESLEDELDDSSSPSRISEFDARIKDIENEVGLISSKLNNIKAENEEIGKRIQEIEDNIRKLLGIYEMVTEGINPFATEVVGSDEGLGLFSAKSEKKEDVPDELLSKDAESFFEDVDDEIEDLSPMDDGMNDIGIEQSSGESPEDKFRKLKAEMSGEGNQVSDTTSQNQDSGVAEPTPVPEPEVPESAPEPEISEPVSELQTQVTVEIEDKPEPSMKHSGPYLTEIKKDYISDIIALKWMDYLVNTFGIKRMAEILDFYSDIGWIGKNVKELLTNYSRGYILKESHLVDEPNPPTLKDHVKSLVFIAKLSGVELDIEEIEKVLKDLEEFERDVSEVVTTEHAISSNC